jgi:galactokinase
VTRAEGVHGARISARGGGGAVTVLADRSGAAESLYQVARAYESETGQQTHVFSGSSDGASLWGARHGQYRFGSWWLD